MKVGEIMNITNIIDVLVFLTIVLMGVIGFKKGFLKQTVSTVGFIIVVILAGTGIFLVKGRKKKTK